MAAFYGIYGYLGDHVHHGLGEPLSANGLLALVYGSGFGLAVLLDGLADRFGARLLLPPAFGAVACVYAAMALTGAGFAALLGAGLRLGTGQPCWAQPPDPAPDSPGSRPARDHHGLE